jgi:hypothetical protein
VAKNTYNHISTPLYVVPGMVLVKHYFIIIIIIIIIISFRHQLGLDRPVLVSSKSLFKGLPCRVRPFGL